MQFAPRDASGASCEPGSGGAANAGYKLEWWRPDERRAAARWVEQAEWFSPSTWRRGSNWFRRELRRPRECRSVGRAARFNPYGTTAVSC